MLLRTVLCRSAHIGVVSRRSKSLAPGTAASSTCKDAKRSFSITGNKNSAGKNDNKPKLCVVDLRGTGFSLMERLCVEEFLSETKTEISWLVIGMHEPSEHRHIHLTRKAPEYIVKSVQGLDHYNPSCAVVVHHNPDTKAKKYSELNVPMIEQDGVLCLESTKGDNFMEESVVLDHSSLITTLIAADDNYTTTDFMTEKLWKPTFHRLEQMRLESPSSTTSPLTMVMDTKSCSYDHGGKKIALDDLKRDMDLKYGVPKTGKQLQLDDLGIDESQEAMPPEMTDPDQSLPLTFAWPHYYLLGDYPVGLINSTSDGIARTVFMWNYEDDNQGYLSCPPPRTISTAPFLRLEKAYQKSFTLSEILQLMCQQHFSVESMNSRDLLKLMAREDTGLQDWWDNRSSWKIIEKFEEGLRE